METVKLDIVQKEPASRVEILVRLVYWIPLVIVMAILGIIAGVLWILNLLAIIFLGKRVLGFTKIIALYPEYYVRVQAYYLLLTDERPPIIPEEKK